jgi:hypothetical protein
MWSSLDIPNSGEDGRMFPTAISEWLSWLTWLTDMRRYPELFHEI